MYSGLSQSHLKVTTNIQFCKFTSFYQCFSRLCCDLSGKCYLDLDLVPPVLCRTLGDELSPSGTIVGSISRVAPVNAQCVQIFFHGVLPCPPWSSDFYDIIILNSLFNCHFGFNILTRHFISKARRRFVSFFLNVHVSAACIRLRHLSHIQRVRLSWPA